MEIKFGNMAKDKVTGFEGVEPNEVKAEENGGPQSHPSGEF
jgi:hypothetical protein